MLGNPNNWIFDKEGLLVSDTEFAYYFSSGDSRLFLLIPQNEAAGKTICSEEISEKIRGKLKKETDASRNSKVLAEYWKNQKTHVSALNLNLTDRCNLDCIYCYAKGGNYSRLKGDMTREIARWGLKTAFGMSDPERDFRIEFFGGEPLLNLPAIEELLDWQKSDPAWNNFPKGTVNRISTNLSTDDENAIRLLHEGKIIVSVSLDGDAPIQDLQRPFKDGRGSFSTIHENLLKLRKIYPDAVMVGRMTVYKGDDRLVEMVEKLVQKDIFDYFSIYPAAVQDDEKKGSSHFSPTFKNQFLSLADHYLRWCGKGRFKGILEVNRYCESIVTGKTVLNHCRGGAGYFTLSPDKSVHPCHRLVGDTGWDLGPFDWAPGDSSERLKPWQTHVEDRKACSNCSLRFLCGGGCKQQQFISTGNLLGNDPRVCAFSRLLFEAALRVIKPLLLDNFENSDRKEKYREVLKKSFGELTRMFVFCGQPVTPNGRITIAPPATIEIGSGVFRVKTLDWSARN